jgi:hypothetical protein
MVVGFTTTCAISAYHDQRFEFISHSWQGVLDTALCDNNEIHTNKGLWLGLWFLTSLSVISQGSVLLMEETRENH